MFLYSIGIHISRLILKLVGVFNSKIKQGVDGRAQTFSILKQALTKNDKTFWFHCASLGEYEQGLPVLTALKKEYPTHKIVLSFFSPSGYEIRKNSPLADAVVYLPLDTKKNAKKFLDLVHPELIVFVKYDIWPNYLLEAKKRNIKAILISALFRSNQIYFKSYGGFMKKALFSFNHIFSQDLNSKELLETINYTNTTVSGDTRFDRVYNQLEQDNSLRFIENFKQDSICLVAGSTWPEDEELLVNYINSTDKSLKMVIAPHTINKNKIEKLRSSITKKTVLYSEKDSVELVNYEVLIIDTIGLLTKIYSYANIAYVGGAMGTTGLHNTLEPAVFAVPIIIGNNYKKFPEAHAMIKSDGMRAVSNQAEFNSVLDSLLKNPDEIKVRGTKNFDYIKKNTGAVIQITNYLRI